MNDAFRSVWNGVCIVFIHLKKAVGKRRACAGHAQMDRFWPAVRQFPALNIEGKHQKQPLSPLSRKLHKERL